MRRLYLHVGYYKTATTSIQDTLYAHNELLQTYDYCYPQVWSSNHTNSLCSIFGNQSNLRPNHIIKGRTPKEVVAHNQWNRNAIIKELEVVSASNIIISAEGASQLLRENIKKLKAFIHNELSIDQIMIIISVREIVSRSASGLQERVKSGGKNLNFRGKNEFRGVIEKFMDIFGKENLRVYRFEDACSDPLGPVGHFCRMVDMPEELIEQLEIKRANEGVSDKAVDLLRFINIRASLIHNNKLREGRSKNDTKLLHTIRGEKFMFDTQTQQRLLEESREDRAWLHEQFGVLYNDIPLKEPPAMVYDESYYEDIVAIYAKLSPLIQELIARYIKEKLQEVNDETSQATLQGLHQWIKHFDGRLSPLFVLFNQEEDPTSIEIYIKLAKMCERDGQLEMALYFIEQGLKLKPHGPHLNKEAKRYRERLGIA
jgi:hypothetical protein